MKEVHPRPQGHFDFFFSLSLSLFLAALGLHSCVQAFFVCGKQGRTVSLQRLLVLWSTGCRLEGFSSCSTQAQ